MQSLNFRSEEDTTIKELSERNKMLSKLLREQQLFSMDGNDYMVEKIAKMIEKLTQSINPNGNENEK